MIVRIMGEGQVDVAPGDLAELNELDSQVEQAIEAGDEAAFRTALHALLDRARRIGKPVPDDDLEPSELILPPSDATMGEVKAMLGDEGLIPD